MKMPALQPIRSSHAQVSLHELTANVPVVRTVRGVAVIPLLDQFHSLPVHIQKLGSDEWINVAVCLVDLLEHRYDRINTPKERVRWLNDAACFFAKVTQGNAPGCLRGDGPLLNKEFTNILDGRLVRDEECIAHHCTEYFEEWVRGGRRSGVCLQQMEGIIQHT